MKRSGKLQNAIMNDNRPHGHRGELLLNQLRAHQKGGLSGWWQEVVACGKERAGLAVGEAWYEVLPTLAGGVTLNTILKLSDSVSLTENQE